MPRAEQHAAFEPELVVFDKDGTLIDFKFMWGRWAAGLCERLEARGHLDVHGMEAFTVALGYDRATGAVHNRSPLCCTPMSEIMDTCIAVVGERAGLGVEAARTAIEEVWSMPCPRADTRALTDLSALFPFIKEELKLKIAVCTTDDRDVTVETLRLLGVDGYVDTLLCGDDKHVAPKPSADQLHSICELLGTSAANTIMVGDTRTDCVMGRAAGVGLVVGIPGGAGSIEDLLEHADVILPSMDNFGRLAAQLTGAAREARRQL